MMSRRCSNRSADTARAFYRALAPDFRCALLTGNGVQIAHGSTKRDQVIASFSPHARTSDAMRIDVLIATDVVSEGVDLHAAQIIVHLDLPWTVARMEQRVGRLRRLGAVHTNVVQYAFHPPGAGERVLRLMQRLARKAGVATGLVGTDAARLLAGERVPVRARRRSAPTSIDVLQQLHSEFHSWEMLAEMEAPECDAVIAAVTAPRRNSVFVALVEYGSGPTIVAGSALGISTRPHDVLAVCKSLAPNTPGIRNANPSDALVLSLVARTLRRLNEWCASEGRRIALVTEGSSAMHRKLIRQLSGVPQHSGRRARRELVTELVGLKALVMRCVGAGGERYLAKWLSEHPDGQATRQDLAELRDALSVRARQPIGAERQPGVLGVLLLIPETGA